MPAAGSPFSDATVPDLARAYGNRPFAALATDDVPESLKSLSREQYEAIRIRPNDLIWGGEPHGFALEPLLRGFYYTDRVALFLVEDGVVRPVSYDPARYDSGGAALPEAAKGTGTTPGFRESASGRRSARRIRISRSSKAPASSASPASARSSASTAAP